MTMRMPLLAIAIALALAVAVIAPSHAQSGTYYRWKDASGVTHYGDAPPPGGKATPVKVKGSMTSSTSATSQPAAPGSTASLAAQAAAAPSGMAAAEQAARTRNCANAKANLNTLSGNALLVDSSDPNSARRMTAEQVEAAQRVANIDVAQNCPKGAP